MHCGERRSLEAGCRDAIVHRQPLGRTILNRFPSATLRGDPLGYQRDASLRPWFTGDPGLGRPLVHLGHVGSLADLVSTHYRAAFPALRDTWAARASTKRWTNRSRGNATPRTEAARIRSDARRLVPESDLIQAGAAIRVRWPSGSSQNVNAALFRAHRKVRIRL